MSNRYKEPKFTSAQAKALGDQWNEGFAGPETDAKSQARPGATLGKRTVDEERPGKKRG